MPDTYLSHDFILIPAPSGIEFNPFLPDRYESTTQARRSTCARHPHLDKHASLLYHYTLTLNLKESIHSHLTPHYHLYIHVRSYTLSTFLLELVL